MATNCSNICPTSSPEFPSTINVNTTNNVLSLANNPAQFRDEFVTITDDSGELTYLPINTASTHVYVNGQLMADPSCWTMNGKIITFKTDVLPDQATVFVKYITRDDVPAESIAEIGTLVVFSTDEIPSGWLLCDGSVLNQADYANLFAVIGHDYFVASLTYANEAAIEAAGKFQLPNLESTVYDGTQYVVKPMIIKY